MVPLSLAKVLWVGLSFHQWLFCCYAVSTTAGLHVSASGALVVSFTCMVPLSLANYALSRVWVVASNCCAVYAGSTVARLHTLAGCVHVEFFFHGGLGVCKM